jgi:hypothetical protein
LFLPRINPGVMHSELLQSSFLRDTCKRIKGTGLIYIKEIQIELKQIAFGEKLFEVTKHEIERNGFDL